MLDDMCTEGSMLHPATEEVPALEVRMRMHGHDFQVLIRPVIHSRFLSDCCLSYWHGRRHRTCRWRVARPAFVGPASSSAVS